MASIPTAHPLDQDTHPLPDIFTEITPYNELHDFELGEVFAHAGMHEYALGQAQWSPGKESSDVFPLQMANEFGFNYPNWSLDLDLELLRGEGEFRYVFSLSFSLSSFLYSMPRSCVQFVFLDVDFAGHFLFIHQISLFCKYPSLRNRKQNQS
jgi:hypothetical protein